MDSNHDLTVFRRDLEREIANKPVAWRTLAEFQKEIVVQFAYRRALQTKFFYARKDLLMDGEVLKHLLELLRKTELAAFQAGNLIDRDFNWEEIIEASDRLGKDSYLTSLYPK